jgi:hypothetical protein
MQMTQMTAKWGATFYSEEEELQHPVLWVDQRYNEFFITTGFFKYNYISGYDLS